MINRPTQIALTFADYLDWAIHNQGRITAKVASFIDRLEAIAEVPVTLVATGPQTVIDYDWPRRNKLKNIA
jgi:adenylosuccinate synthase